MKKRTLSPFAWVMSFIALLFLITGIFIMVIQWVTFQKAYYVKEYERLGISEATGMDDRDLMAATGVLLNYIKGKRDNLAIEVEIHGIRRPVFNQREKDHMVDVRNLFILSDRLKWLLLGAFIILTAIVSFIKGKAVLRDYSLLYLLLLGLLVLLALGLSILMLKDFTLLWNRFHHIFFRNDLWLLDPETDILIQMVPEEFFFNTIIRIFSLFARIVVGLGVMALIVLIRCEKAEDSRQVL